MSRLAGRRSRRCLAPTLSHPTRAVEQRRYVVHFGVHQVEAQDPRHRWLVLAASYRPMTAQDTKGLVFAVKFTAPRAACSHSLPPRT